VTTQAANTNEPPIPELAAAPILGYAMPRARSPWLTAAKWLLFAAVLAIVGRVLYQKLREAPWDDLRVGPGWIAMGVACLLVSGVLGVIIRRLLLAGFCTPPGWLPMAAASWVPLVGKYVPGKVFSLAGTMWLLRRHGVRDSVAASMLFMTMGLSMTLGLALSIPLTFWGPVASRVPFAGLWGGLLLGAFVVALHPRVFAALSNYALARFRRPPLASFPRLRNYVEPMLIILFNWGLTGLTLWLIARSMTDVSPAHIPLFVSAAALAATIGLMAFFAPAGVGVREGIQFAVLVHIIPQHAAIAVLAMRLLQTLVEMVLVAVGLGIQAAIGDSPPAT